MHIRRIKACLNGGRTSTDHPGVPISPDELAIAAKAAVHAGAEAIHLHPRDARGEQSVAAQDVAAAVEAVRRACPDTPIGVTTGLWITGGDADARQASIERWRGLDPVERPDFASLNVAEDGANTLAATLVGLGVGIEAGVWSPADADLLAEAPYVANCLRVLVEVLDTPADRCLSAADAILARMDAHQLNLPRLLHGEDDSAWPLLRYAGRLGLPTRIGLEDAIVGPHGEPVRDNAELIAIGLRLMS
ncbi:3-keto-5-aminohexanoate cleavage protein [Micromonospora sp. NPDC003197]